MLAPMIKFRFRLVVALALSAVVAAAICPAQAVEDKKRPAKHHAKHAGKKKAKAAAAATSAAGGTAATVATAKPAAASAAAAQRLGEAGAWTAYTTGEAANRVCYVVGKPDKAESNGGGRKPPMAMVTHRPAENVANVVSFVEGYPLKEGSDVALAVGSGKFELFTKDDSA